MFIYTEVGANKDDKVCLSTVAKWVIISFYAKTISLWNLEAMWEILSSSLKKGEIIDMPAF